MKTLIVSNNDGFAEEVKNAAGGCEYEIKRLNERFTLDFERIASGEAVIDPVNTRDVDLLIVDTELPGISGLAVLECIDPLENDLNIILILPESSVKDAVTAVKCGAFDVLARPWSPEELRDAVRKAGRNLVLTRKVKALQSEKNLIRHEFFSLLSHELKAPLNAIQGYLSILKDRFVEIYITDWDLMVDRCLGRVLQMKKMTDDILMMTLIESGRKIGETVEFDLYEKIRESVDTVSLEAYRRKIDIEVYGDGQFPVVGDPADISLILNNLVSNAVKYNNKNGSVTISAAVNDETLRIVVADTGIGMTPEEQALIFKDFIRVKNKDTYKVIGTGLGLSLVKKIVDIHGGTIRVDSRRGEGSEFTVELPLSMKQETER